MVQRRTDISHHNDSACNAIYYGEQLAFIKENGNLFTPKIYFPYRFPVLTFDA